MNHINFFFLRAKILFLSATLIIACSETKLNNEISDTNKEEDIPAAVNGLTEEEISQGWEYLFDGHNISKLTGVKNDTFPAKAWTIEDGALVLSGNGRGDIITRDKYSDFELVLDFKLTDSANSGIKYFVGDMIDKDNEGETIFNGPEYQIIDDYNHPAVTDDEKGNLISTGALYLLYPPDDKKLNPAGEWNTARIVAKDKHVEHWLNGVNLLTYKRGTEDFRQRVSNTKFKNQKNYGELENGHIMITDHTDKVYFKNIKIRRL